MFRVLKGRNEIEVCNNNKQLLRDGDTIGILDESFVIYTSICENGPRTKFPPALCDEYLMGSKVGDGSTCVVHEAWRRKTEGRWRSRSSTKYSRSSTKYSVPQDLMKEVNILK